MPNIIEQQEQIMGLSKEALVNYAQNPSGALPMFLVVERIKDLGDQEKRFLAQQEQPQGTVSEQIVAEATAPQGIGALQPQMQPQMQQQMPPGASGGVMPPPNAMQQPPIPPEMIAAQMNAQSQMMAATGGRMPYPAMADGGVVPPNSLVEDASKFDTESLYDMDASQIAMANPMDMGVPKVLDDNKPKTSLASSLKKSLSRARQSARFGDLGLRGGNITGRGSMTLPIRGNPLELGASGYVGRDGAGITSLDASYKMPKDRFIQGRYHPKAKSWGIQFGGRFNQGGIVKMQQGQVVEPDAVVDPPVDPMAVYAEQQQQRYDKMREYIEDVNAADRERQKQEMMSQALINIGAGIASGNVAAGLEKAGAHVANTRAAQRKREQDLQLQLMSEMPGGAGAGGSRVQSTQILENGNIGLVMSDGTIVDTNQKSLRTAGLKNIMVAGVPHHFDAVTGTLTPLGTQAGEIGFETAAQRAEFEEDQRQESLTEAPRVANALFDAVNTTGVVDQAVDDAMQFLESNTTAGAVGAPLSWIPGTDMFALGITLDTLKANLGFDRLQRMREASPTGGALGQVSERELDLLVRAAGAIEQGLPPDILRERLEYLREDYKKIRDQAISSFIFHADSIDDEDVTKDYQRRIDLAERLAANPNASPGSRRSNQAAVDAWDDFQRRYGNVEELSEADELAQMSSDLDSQGAP